jgi:ABC-type uncharacterized transport system substrate-binding protein
LPINKLYFWIACVVVFFYAAGARAQSVVIVSSDQSAAYAQADAAATASLQAAGVSRGEITSRGLDEWREDEPALLAARVIVTLGSEALRQVLTANPKAHVLSALIPRSGFQRVVQEFKGRESGLTVLYLDQPLARQVDLVRIAMPRARKIGALLGPESVQFRPELAAQLRAAGLTLSDQRVEAGALAKTLKVVLEDADVLLALPDAQVFNSNTVANVLLATYHARVPVIAFSPAYVKAGAMLALFSTPEQTGIQAGNLAGALLSGRHVEPVQFPNDFVVGVNASVARSLGYALDPAEVTRLLRRQGAQP